MPGPVQSIERAAAILRLLAGGSGRLGLGEIADVARPGQGHRARHPAHARSASASSNRTTHTGKYQLGAALLHLGTSYLDVNELRSRAINWADPLAARSGEAVRIGTLLDGQVLVVHHVFRPDDTLQTLDVGALLPLHATRWARCCWPTTRRPGPRSRAGWSAFTRRTMRRAAALARALAEVRERGWAAEIEEIARGAGRASPRRSAATAGWWSAPSASPGPVERICDGTGRPKPALVDLRRGRRPRGLPGSRGLRVVARASLRS